MRPGACTFTESRLQPWIDERVAAMEILTHCRSHPITHIIDSPLISSVTAILQDYKRAVHKIEECVLNPYKSCALDVKGNFYM